ncbi:MAG: trypsin-like peptidase domain-containing protein [Pseudomonadales bacterium]|nr:trypsin-like peptidase domain-containing protein [Pseudomonadales bacterium]
MKLSIRYFAIPVCIGLMAGFAVILLQAGSMSIFDRPQEQPIVARDVFSYADAIAMATPAVVNIYTKKATIRKNPSLFDDPFFRQFFGPEGVSPRQNTQSSLGSGVIVSEQGYIVTNYHVIEGASDIIVLLQDGRSSNAKVIGTDAESDIAVLKTELTGLTPIKLARAHRVEVGDVVFAIGNPFGVGQTVTMGIISATGRAGLGLNRLQNFIQTDAAINPGNSGGALVNANGALIGINSALFSRSGGSQGIGFAIPSDYARKTLLALINDGHVTRGWLGIDAREILVNQTTGTEVTARKGILIDRVHENSPAQHAGLENGDIIISINDTYVKNGRNTAAKIVNSKPGQTLDIGVIRDARVSRHKVVIGIRPPT